MKNYGSLFSFTLCAQSLYNNIFPAYLGLSGNVICVWFHFYNVLGGFSLSNVITAALSFHAP